MTLAWLLSKKMNRRGPVVPRSASEESVNDSKPPIEEVLLDLATLQY